MSILLSFILTGLIWAIQLVHYPSFKFIAPQKFHEFNIFHQKQMTYLVAPLMVLEIVSAFFLVYFKSRPIDFFMFFIVGIIWLSTFLISVPLHAKLLSGGYNLVLINKLVLTNWPRTLLWSVKSGLLVYYFKIL